MKRTTLMAGLAAVALLSWGLGANAGSWPNLPAKAKAGPAKQAVEEKRAPEGAYGSTNDGFEFVGGEAGWALKQAKYEFVAGRLAHSSDCVFASAETARKLPAPTGRAIDYSPGA